jgi:hypothetical protein
MWESSAARRNAGAAEAPATLNRKLRLSIVKSLLGLLL